MAKAVLGKCIGKQLAAVLGLPPMTADFSIHIPVYGFVTVDAKIYVRDDCTGQVIETLRRFTLQEKPSNVEASVPASVPSVV
jgi:hypothetical protein